jgi:hypothetical protein
MQNVTIQKIADADLRYQLIAKFGPVRFCDPDCAGPCNIARKGKHAEEAFAKITQDDKTFHSILQHVGFQSASGLSAEQRGSVYGEYEKLVCGMSLEPRGEDLNFTFMAASGYRIKGVVKLEGEIVVLDKEPVALICPK